MKRRHRVSLVLLGVLLVVASGSGPAATPATAAAPISFRVEVSGGGPPMILIPGLASSGETWTTTVSRYKERYTCHVLTLAGFAGVPPITAPLLATVRTELADYIRANRLERPVVVGHSLGGALAMGLAIDHPDLVGPIVVVDSLPFLAGAQMQAKTADDAKPATAAMRAYLSNMTRAQYEQYVEAGAATRFMVTSERDHEVLKRWSLASDPATVGNAMADLFEMDLRNDLARVSSPTLVLGAWAGLHEQLKAYGTNLSRAQVVETFAAQFEQLRPLRFALSETARHFIMFDDPTWFFEQLDAFLANPAAAIAVRGVPAP